MTRVSERLKGKQIIRNFLKGNLAKSITNIKIVPISLLEEDMTTS